MTIKTVIEVLKQAEEYFAGKKLETPRLDAEVLLAEALATDRLSLYTNWERPLKADELDRYRDFVRRRAQGCPAAYLRGKKEFMSIEFRVTPEVMIPRPETEFVLEAALDATGKDDEFDAADLCTGSGCIAVSLAHYRPNAKVHAVDASAAALEVARGNAGEAGCTERVEFYEGDLYEPLADMEGAFDVIVSNPPYVTGDEFASLPAGIRDYEPHSAFLAGADGLDVLRRIVSDAPRFLKPGGLLAVEIGCTQAEAVSRLVEETEAFEPPEVVKDYSKLDRVVKAVRKK